MRNATHRATWYPVLGTELHLQLDADPGAAPLAEAAVLEVFRSADAELSVWRDDGALARWRRGELEQPPASVVEVLRLAERWWRHSGGAFHPATGALSGAWDAAAATGTPPPRAQLDQLVTGLQTLPWRELDGRLHRTGDTAAVQLDAVAKGWVVDRAVEAALRVPGVRGVLVNCGGELRHAGTGVERVRIEDPARVVDNAPGLTVVELANRSLATSANTRRGRRIGDEWFGHVFDPRTGRPMPGARQATAIAADVATADAAATVALVAGRDELPGLLGVPGPFHATWLVVDDGVVTTSADWPAAVSGSR